MKDRLPDYQSCHDKGAPAPGVLLQVNGVGLLRTIVKFNHNVL